MRRVRNWAFVFLCVVLMVSTTTPLSADFAGWQSGFGCSTWLFNYPVSFVAECNPGSDPLEFCEQFTAACADFCRDWGGVTDSACSPGGLTGCNCLHSDPQ